MPSLILSIGLRHNLEPVPSINSQPSMTIDLVSFKKSFPFLMCFYCATDSLPYSIRVLLESAVRNCDEYNVLSSDVEKIMDWVKNSQKEVDIPFKPARVIL